MSISDAFKFVKRDSFSAPTSNVQVHNVSYEFLNGLGQYDDETTTNNHVVYFKNDKVIAAWSIEFKVGIIHHEWDKSEDELIELLHFLEVDNLISPSEPSLSTS